MAITLEQMKEGMDDKVSAQVIDTFLRESEILQALPFDDAVSPSGGSTLVYGYVQTKLPSTAAFREINSEYTASEATVEKKSVELKVFGGKFSIDRVINQANARYNNLAYQMEQKIRAAVSLFHHTLINGDATTNDEEFDGLDQMLAGTATEYNAVNTSGAAAIDISTIAKIKENADQFYEALCNLIADTNADALLVNRQTLSKIQTVARVLGYKTESEKAFGKRVTVMDGVRLMDLGNHYTVSASTATANPVVPLGLSRKIQTADSGNTTGLTDIYAVHFDVEEGFLAATLTGSNAISQYLPNFNEAGAVKDGEVEMVAATVLKNTNSAGVLRNVKIA